MCRPKAVIFDFDGTLVDTMDGFADIAAAVIHRRYGMEQPRARREYLRTSGLPFRQQLEVIYPGDPRNDDAAREFEDTKVEGFFSEEFSDEVKDTIGELRQRGFYVVVSSNNMQELVDRFVARDHVQFHMVLGARRDFFKGRDHFDHVRRTLGVREDEMVFVGDSLKDAEKALSNNVRFVGKLGTFRDRDFQRHFPGVQTVDRLPKLLEVFQ